MWMFLPWAAGIGLFGLLLRWLFKIWDKLDEPTKKLIIETTIKAFEIILRAFYRWWKQRGS